MFIKGGGRGRLLLVDLSYLLYSIHDVTLYISKVLITIHFYLISCQLVHSWWVSLKLCSSHLKVLKLDGPVFFNSAGSGYFLWSEIEVLTLILTFKWLLSGVPLAWCSGL